MHTREYNRHVGLVLLAAVAAAGCGSETAEPVWTATERDGVRIVEISGPVAELPEYATVGEPDLVIGSRDGAAEYVFGMVGAVRSLPGGGVFVTDLQDQMIRLYDEVGGYVGAFGGRGDGPGEFRAVFVAGAAGDSVWMWDPIHQRVTVVLADAGSGTIVTFDHEPAEGPSELRRLEDGSYLAQSRYGALDPLDPKFTGSRVWTDSLVLRHLDPSGADLDTIAVVPMRQVVRDVVPRNAGDGRPIGSHLPFGAETVWASDARGTSVTVEGQTGAMTIRDLGGRTTAEVRFTDPPGPIPPSEVARKRDSWFEGTREDPELRRMVEKVFSDEVLPQTMPRVSAVKMGPAGEVWVAEYATFLDEVDEWVAFSFDGEPLGRLILPQGFRVYEIGPDYILGVQKDEADVEYVQRLPLERRDAPG